MRSSTHALLPCIWLSHQLMQHLMSSKKVTDAACCADSIRQAFGTQPMSQGCSAEAGLHAAPGCRVISNNNIAGAVPQEWSAWSNMLEYL
jgi:hypothetical protein